MQEHKHHFFVYALIFILQTAMLSTFSFLHGTALIFCMMLIFLGTAILFAKESCALSHQLHDLAVFARKMLPYCIRLTGIIAADALLFCFIRNYVDFAVVWLVFSILTVVFSGGLVFAIGAGRTMLYADR